MNCEAADNETTLLNGNITSYHYMKKYVNIN